MALKLKKSYHLDKDKPEVQELVQLGTDIQVSFMLLNTSKKELANSMNKRNNILRDILLDDCNYLLSPNDKVLFLDQTSEIRIYDTNGTTSEQMHNFL